MFVASVEGPGGSFLGYLRETTGAAVQLTVQVGAGAFVFCAQMLARAKLPATVFLRAGTYYLGETLALTALDSGLTIEAYKDEVADISGAMPIEQVKFEPYNVTKTGGATMTSDPNSNALGGLAIHQGGDTPCVHFAGKQPSSAACSALCLGNSSCQYFTWHDAQQPAGSVSWDEQCHLVNVGAGCRAYSTVPQTHHSSGAKVITKPKNVYVARNVQLPPGMDTFTGLRINGKRMIRARWPNGDPEYQLFPAGWEATAAWAPPKQFPPAEDITNLSPNRSAEGPCSSSSGYCYYVTGVGGACSALGHEPPSGYWCSSDPPRGRGYSTAFPSALTAPASAFGGRAWPSWRANETVINAFRQGHWFSYVFLLDEYDAATNRMSWSVGGFQGGEGCGSAGEWNVENVFEELDSESEWYFDSAKNDLYYFHNDTAAPPPTLEIAGTKLEQLVTITGGGSARGETAPHARDISIVGVKLTGAALSTLSPHGLPSDGGGDWAIARVAAVHVSGVENVLIQGCVFERIDGNGVMISGYSRNTTVDGNEFHLVGENGVVSWGYTADWPDAKRAVPIPATQGPDARDGNHPRGNVISNNYFHEFGHFQKQVSCYFQAQTQGTTLAKNICFNGPRAGFNFNDGMGGGDVLAQNLVFNMVRETQDHGSFNSWDRQPFFSLSPDGKGTYVPAYREITRNFWINDYNSQEATDNDDGSCYYNTHHNFFPFSSGGLKNDFGGHDNHHHNNIYYVSSNCMGVCAQKPGHEDSFYNNTCIINNNSPEYARFSPGIGGPAFPVMHDNKVLTLDGLATESGKSISAWQAQGHDLATTVGKLPADAELIAMAKGVLQMV